MTVSKEDIPIKEQNRLFDEWRKKRPVEPRVARPVMADPDLESWFIVAVVGTVLCFLAGVNISSAYVLASSPTGEIGAFAWLLFPALWLGTCYLVTRAVPYIAWVLYRRKLVATGWAEYDTQRQQWLECGEATFSQWLHTNAYVAAGYDDVTS